MPTPTLILDLVANAQVQRDENGIRILRSGYIKDIDTSLPPEQILVSALAVSGMPTYLTAFPVAGLESCLLRRVLIDTFPGVNNKVKVLLYYDTGGPATPPPSTFILSRNTTLVERITEVHPRDWEPITIGWTNPNDSSDVRKDDTAQLRYLTPFQRLVATGYFIGEPPDEMISALGKVNSLSWRGYDTGYWLYASQSDVTQDRGLSYMISLEFWNRIVEDWSQAAVFRDQHGQFLKVDPTDASDLRDSSYSYGIERRNGIVKVGLYDTDDFNSIFGF